MKDDSDDDANAIGGREFDFAISFVTNVIFGNTHRQTFRRNLENGARLMD